LSVLELQAPAASPFGTRLSSAGRAALYLLAGIPLGVLHLLLLLPAFFLRHDLAWRLAEVERALANRVLCTRIPAFPVRAAAAGAGAPTPERRIAAFLAARLPVTLAATLATAIPVAVTITLIRYAAEGLTGSNRYFGPWHLGVATGLALLALAVPAAILSIAGLDAARTLLYVGARRMLTPQATESGAVREMLAESIGDRSLTIAYWVPERSAFVDEHGYPVELPERGSGRAWTAVENDGRRVAAIIHDEELDARPELVGAAAAGSVLALDNERLKAELRARVEDLRSSRARIVEASMEARRRLERDLHDGAQQHLVALSLELQLIKNRLEDEGTRGLVDGALEHLATALEELRELARGIHPAILSDRGLPDALASLAARATVPVELDVELDERPVPAVEAAAYFVAAEALTNVAKYASARAATVRLRRSGDCIDVEVIDDGVGGADPDAGSGLRGLEDRVAALDGTLTVESPRGRGTRVHVRLPLASTAASAA
jgi:signal transduction histidine kinase